MKQDGSREAYGRKRRPGEYACVGVDLINHHRAVVAGQAMGTWTWMVLFSCFNELDGFVPDCAIRQAWVGEEQARRDVEALASPGCGLVTRHTSAEGVEGWVIINYADWNETRTEVEIRREKARERMRSLRVARQSERPAQSIEGVDVRGTFAARAPHVRRTFAVCSPFVPSPSGLSSSDFSLPPSRPAEVEGSSYTRARATPPPPRPDTLLPPPPLPVGPESGPSAAPAGRSATFTPCDGGVPTPPPENASTGRLEADPSAGRRERPLGLRRLEQPFVVKAYTSGVSGETGAPYAVPRNELAALDDALDTHCPHYPQASEEGLAWLCQRAAAFRCAIKGREQWHKGGIGPRGFLEWLNRGCPTAEELSMTPDELAAHRAEEARKAKAAKVARARRRHEVTEEAEAVPISEAKAQVADLMAAIGVGPR